jgi:predicted aldo/keto reductase-like oxidoreductase
LLKPQIINTEDPTMKRRTFIQLTTTAVPMLSLFPGNLSAIVRDTSGLIEKRSLGKTGEKLSILGFGGIVVMDATSEQSAERVKMAIDKGINYFDVAPSYGNAEIMLGPALEPYRKDVFLACKTTERKRESARKELEQSLERLRTDHFDLYQLHAVTSLEDVETIFSKGGAMETFLEARKEGKIRFIGFSAHSVEAAMALMDNFDFDTLLFPTNYTTWYAGNFGPQVLQRAHDKGMGILALKAMAKGPYPEGTTNKVEKCWYEPLNTPEEALLGLRFTLSHPVTAAIPPGNEALFKMALDLIPRIAPLADNEVIEIKDRGLKGKPLFLYPMKAV